MWAERVKVFGLAAFLILSGCGGGGGSTSSNGTSNDPSNDPQGQFRGVLSWKGSSSGNGLYANEAKLKPSNVNTTQFGRVAHYPSNGAIVAQPLYVANLEMGSAGTHNVVFVSNEVDEVMAFDADGKSPGTLWRRSYLGPGVTPGEGNRGGRTGLGPNVGITGTPVIDTTTAAMYFVTTLVRNGTYEQWLRAVDIRTGEDFGPGSVQIKATVPGDGPGSVNGHIPFNPSIQNQRPGLQLLNGQVLIGWGSFSDNGVYRGWLMAYDAHSLQQTAVFSPATQRQADDIGGGPADHGGGGSLWAGGAAPAVDRDGNIYVVPADGSFNADTGGKNYGDTVLKLRLGGNGFEVADYFSPANHDCLDKTDLEIGSGGFTLLPSDAAAGRPLGMVVTKAGGLYLLDPGNLGKIAPNDSQVPQYIQVGNRQCSLGPHAGHAEGTDWQRLYGNPVYWNNSVYLAPSNSNLRQYRFNGSTLSTTPASTSSTTFFKRGANSVVSANGNSDGIVWTVGKTSNGTSVIHAYDANDVSRELWNSEMSGRDHVGGGTAFSVPVVVDGKVIVAGSLELSIYSLK